MISREIIQKLKKTYPVGSRVKLIQMEDDQAPPVGTLGTVYGVDAIGSILVKWDNGSMLNVIFRVDRIEKILNKDWIIAIISPNQLDLFLTVRLYVHTKKDKEKNMAYKYMKTQEDLNELIDSSAITMLGLYEGENGDLAFQDYLKDYLEDDTIYITMGKTINKFYESYLPEDLRIVSLKYNKLGRLPIIRLEIGAKWFDDVIDNLQKNKKRGVR